MRSPMRTARNPPKFATTVEQVDSLVRATRLRLSAGELRSLTEASG